MKEYKGYDDSFNIKDKVAVVTGGGQGIGEAIALLFAKKGADIVVVDIDEKCANAVAQKVVEMGRKSISIILDITKKSNAEAIAQKACDEFGGIDILVNCAGIAMLDDAENLSEEAWDKTIAVNLKAPFILSQAVGKKMIARGHGGKIINLASQAALISLDRHLAYNCSKGGLISMTQVLACEWAEFDIQVNAISPTVILTELGKKAWAGEVGEVMKKKIPAGRFGYPDEVAACALFLASDAADMITGSNLVIDGGYTVQ